ncbi:cupin domain-containing protein [Mycolicibacterium sp. 624]|uniref:helix-turn-helix domain-containing protein n=1 Tax=Mycolicibacterium sp. 624 TaxID=3156314 RepID=UPI0033973604
MTAEEAASEAVGPGQRIRELRMVRQISLRELARRAGCSASLLSQIERGIVAPSARIVYALANELSVSLDSLFGATDSDTSATLVPPELGAAPADDVSELTTESAPSGAWGRATGADGQGIVQRADTRQVIELSSGVRWERLTPNHDPYVDFIEAVYRPEGRSSETGQSIRHQGREYLQVLEGEIEAVIGFETIRLCAGDSISFDPSTPHQYRNPSRSAIARCLSVVVNYAT